MDADEKAKMDAGSQFGLTMDAEIKLLRARVANLETTLHALWRVIQDSDEFGAYAGYSVIFDHIEAAKSLGVPINSDRMCQREPDDGR